MSKFKNRLKELVGNNVEQFVSELGFCNKSLVYKWLKEDNLPNLRNLLKIANHYKISIDYILGRTDDCGESITTETLSFNSRFNEILTAKGISKYKLFKTLGFGKGHQYAWFTLGKLPSIDNLIKIADYLGVSVDFLVGRV